MDLSIKIALLTDIEDALDSDRRSLGTVNPQFSYFKRIAEEAACNDDKLRMVHDHITRHGSFWGL